MGWADALSSAGVGALGLIGANQIKGVNYDTIAPSLGEQKGNRMWRDAINMMLNRYGGAPTDTVQSARQLMDSPLGETMGGFGGASTAGKFAGAGAAIGYANDAPSWARAYDQAGNLANTMLGRSGRDIAMGAKFAKRGAAVQQFQDELNRQLRMAQAAQATQQAKDQMRMAGLSQMGAGLAQVPWGSLGSAGANSKNGGFSYNPSDPWAYKFDTGGINASGLNTGGEYNFKFNPYRP